MKYELTSETMYFDGKTLHRIRALKDISKMSVKAGDLGGWVESEENLSQDGDCWIFDDAKVCDSARVYDSARVCGLAIVYDSARVRGSAVVRGLATVYDSAIVYDSAVVYGLAEVYGSVSKTPIHITGLRWPITIEDTHMSIGCQYHSIADWESFDDDTIDQMADKALDFWIENKDLILTLAKRHMKSDN